MSQDATKGAELLAIQFFHRGQTLASRYPRGSNAPAPTARGRGDPQILAIAGLMDWVAVPIFVHRLASTGIAVAQIFSVSSAKLPVKISSAVNVQKLIDSGWKRMAQRAEITGWNRMAQLVL
jgi:hypothetical protein